MITIPMKITSNDVVVPVETKATKQNVDMNVEGGFKHSTDYNDLKNRPTIEGVLLSGDMTLDELNAYTQTEIDSLLSDKASKGDIPSLADYYTKTETNGLLNEKADASALPTKTSDLTNDSGYITLADLPIYNGGVS